MFYVGQRVEFVVGGEDAGHNNLLVGDVGTIIDDSGGLLVELDKCFGGHSGSGHGKDGYCWWVAPEWIKPYTEDTEEQEAPCCTDEDINAFIFG